jgi:hypothetical protein
LALLVAAIAFLVANLFVQVPVSVLGILFTQNKIYEETTPINIEDIPKNLTVPGLRVRKIFFIPELSA